MTTEEMIGALKEQGILIAVEPDHRLLLFSETPIPQDVREKVRARREEIAGLYRRRGIPLNGRCWWPHRDCDTAGPWYRAVSGIGPVWTNPERRQLPAGGGCDDEP